MVAFVLLQLQSEESEISFQLIPLSFSLTKSSAKVVELTLPFILIAFACCPFGKAALILADLSPFSPFSPLSIIVSVLAGAISKSVKKSA